MGSLVLRSPPPLRRQHVASWVSQGFLSSGSTFPLQGQWAAAAAALVSLVSCGPQVMGLCVLGVVGTRQIMSVPGVSGFQLGWEWAVPDHLVLVPFVAGAPLVVRCSSALGRGRSWLSTSSLVCSILLESLVILSICGLLPGSVWWGGLIPVSPIGTPSGRRITHTHCAQTHILTDIDTHLIYRYIQAHFTCRMRFLMTVWYKCRLF